MSGGVPAAYDAISFTAQSLDGAVSNVRSTLGSFSLILGTTACCCQRFSSGLTRVDQTTLPCASAAAGGVLPPPAQPASTAASAGAASAPLPSSRRRVLGPLLASTMSSLLRCVAALWVDPVGQQSLRRRRRR